MNKQKFELPKSFLKACKQGREAAGMTLEDMAELCGSSRQLIYTFENGGSNNGYFVLCYIRAFGLTDSLCGGEKNED